MRVFSTGIYLEIGEQLATQAIVGQHTLDSLFHWINGATQQHGTQGESAESAGMTTVVVILLLQLFAYLVQNF